MNAVLEEYQQTRSVICVVNGTVAVFPLASVKLTDCDAYRKSAMLLVEEVYEYATSATLMTSYPDSDGITRPCAALTVAVSKTRPSATPSESVIPFPADAPSASISVTVASATGELSAVNVTSSWRIRVNIPVPVTSTLDESTVPSIKSTFAALLITTSLVLPMVTSVRVISPAPSVSTPIAFDEIDMLSKLTSLSVF